MRLRTITIKHFRGIQELSFTLYDFTSLIGPNNASKSTTLRAIQLFLGGLAPKLHDWHKGETEKPIVIEGFLDEVTEEEESRPGVAGLVVDGAIHLRYTASFNKEKKKVEVSYTAISRPEEMPDGWSEKWTDLSEEIRTIAGAHGADSKNWRKEHKDKVKEDLRKLGKTKWGKPEWTDESISFPNALQQALPRVILVPAVREASTESSSGNTAFGELLDEVLLPSLKATDEYKQFEQATSALKTLLRPTDPSKATPEAFETTGKELNRRLASLLAAEVRFDMSDPDMTKLLNGNIAITLDDGHEAPVELQGHGLQRTLIFALLETQVMATTNKALAAEPKPKRPIVLLFEEPELFMHPHMMRRLKRVLKSISDKPDWQVVVTTHSPFLVDVANEPRSLVIMRKASDGKAIVPQLANDPFAAASTGKREKRMLRAALDFHPTVAEAFFARESVLVEGDSEVAILRLQPALLTKCGVTDGSAGDITIVSCGGKWTIVAMARLLAEFKMPFRVIHDRDRKGRTDDQIAKAKKIDPFFANAKIAEIVAEERLLISDDTLEDTIGMKKVRSSKDKPYRAWNYVKKLVQKKKDPTPLHPGLRRLVRFAYLGEKPIIPAVATGPGVAV